MTRGHDWSLAVIMWRTFTSCFLPAFTGAFVHGRDAGYPAPPAQIPACGTTAPGSCLGSDAEAFVWVWVYYTHGRYPLCDPSLEAGPRQGFPFLAASAQGSQPGSDYLGPKGIGRGAVSGDCVVIEVSSDH